MPPPPNAAVFAQLKAGDTVRVTMRTGEKVTFTLEEVRAEGVVAKDGRHISFGDIWQLEKRHTSGTKTVVAVAIPLVLLAFVAYVADALRSMTAEREVLDDPRREGGPS